MKYARLSVLHQKEEARRRPTRKFGGRYLPEPTREQLEEALTRKLGPEPGDVSLPKTRIKLREEGFSSRQVAAILKGQTKLRKGIPLHPVEAGLLAIQQAGGRVRSSELPKPSLLPQIVKRAVEKKKLAKITSKSHIALLKLQALRRIRLRKLLRRYDLADELEKALHPEWHGGPATESPWKVWRKKAKPEIRERESVLKKTLERARVQKERIVRPVIRQIVKEAQQLAGRKGEAVRLTKKLVAAPEFLGEVDPTKGPVRLKLAGVRRKALATSAAHELAHTLHTIRGKPLPGESYISGPTKAAFKAGRRYWTRLLKRVGALKRLRKVGYAWTPGGEDEIRRLRIQMAADQVDAAQRDRMLKVKGKVHTLGLAKGLGAGMLIGGFGHTLWGIAKRRRQRLRAKQRREGKKKLGYAIGLKPLKIRPGLHIKGPKLPPYWTNDYMKALKFISGKHKDLSETRNAMRLITSLSRELYIAGRGEAWAPVPQANGFYPLIEPPYSLIRTATRANTKPATRRVAWRNVAESTTPFRPLPPPARRGLTQLTPLQEKHFLAHTMVALPLVKGKVPMFLGRKVPGQILGESGSIVPIKRLSPEEWTSRGFQPLKFGRLKRKEYYNVHVHPK